MPKSFVIAIDGPSAAGKGTLGRKIALHYDLAHLDTGALYRAVAFGLDQQRLPFTPENAVAIANRLDLVWLDRRDLRNERIGGIAAEISAFPSLRQALIAFQRDFAQTPPRQKSGAVLDGRDIGTVICPDAPVKLFVTARAEIRAQRRCKELQDRGERAIYAQILQDIEARDRRDRERPIAPLIPAEDAQLIDTSDHTADEVFATAKQVIDRKWKEWAAE